MTKVRTVRKFTPGKLFMLNCCFACENKIFSHFFGNGNQSCDCLQESYKKETDPGWTSQN